MRAPQDAEILIAIVAGQIASGHCANPGGICIDYPEFVDHAEAIVTEVFRRNDLRSGHTTLPS